jgi:uncharacterized protein YkwD
MARRLCDRLSFLALGLGLFTLGCGDVTSIPGASEANPLDTEEGALVQALNSFRGGLGISTPVEVCSSLNVSASKHADDMRDKGYLSDKGKDGSTPRTRGCAAGYAPACSDSTLSMAESVASGFVTGSQTLPQWTMDANTKGILSNPALNVVGVGRALQGDAPTWALDLASKDDTSCH